MKYERDFVRFFSKQNVFKTDDVRRFLSSAGASEAYIRVMLHNMVRSGRLHRIGKGSYSFHRNEAVVGFQFRPFYYGLQYALTIRKIWTQQSIPVIITKQKANPGVRVVMSTKVIVHRISESAFFGFDYVNYSGMFVPVSDPEKTLLDFKYFGMSLDHETMATLKKLSKESKLREYATKLF